MSVVVQTGGKVTCRNSKTARNDSDELGLDRGVRYNHWVQPRGVRYNHWVQPRGVTTRVVTRGRPAACSELACCGRPRPRVVIVVQTPPRVTVVVPTPPRVTVVVPTPCCNHSCCNSKTPPHAYALFSCWGESANRGTTTGLKPELQLHSPPNRRYCPRLHARGSGYFLRAVGPA